MTRNHSCGGKFRRTDIRAVPANVPGGFLYEDTDNLKANWKCDKCGAVRTQRKRQPGKK